MEKSASQARIFDSNEKSILSKAIVKQGTAGWHGVSAHSTHLRTCDIEVPRGHATVKCGTVHALIMILNVGLTGTGKYFEVRYFLNVIVGTSHTLVTFNLDIIQMGTESLQKACDRSAADRSNTYG